MRSACCLPKATDKLSEYVVLIVSLRQHWLRLHWLRQRLSMLPNAYTACLPCVIIRNTYMQCAWGYRVVMYVSVFVVEHSHKCALL